MKGLFIGGLWGLASSEPVLSRSTREADTLEEQGSRRYWQLEDLMEFFNPTFDERKYWTYGCNCLMLGDRPMSDPGLGPPVDAVRYTILTTVFYIQYLVLHNYSKAVLPK